MKCNPNKKDRCFPSSKMLFKAEEYKDGDVNTILTAFSNRFGQAEPSGLFWLTPEGNYWSLPNNEPWLIEP
jgi:hypothetical protein